MQGKHQCNTKRVKRLIMVRATIETHATHIAHLAYSTTTRDINAYPFPWPVLSVTADITNP